MRLKYLHHLIVIIVALMGVVGLGWWLQYNPADHLSELMPGMDNRPESMKTVSDAVNIGIHFTRFDGVPSFIVIVPCIFPP